MLARLQRTICLSLLLLSIAWLMLFWAWSPMLALVGPALPVLGYATILAVEFGLLARMPSAEVARPTGLQLGRAWLAEVGRGVQVFFWRQPFRSNAQADHLPAGSTRRGVVFVHGLMCNRGFWAPWMRQAQAMGLPCLAVNLEPPFGDIDLYAPTIDAAVARMQAATGQPPVLICHSMGGLAARAWLLAPGAARRVAHVVTIASPHTGTWMARFGHGRSSRQMRLGSDWLRTLAHGEVSAASTRFTCWYSNCDNIVFPVSTATLPGADNRLLTGQPHVALAFHSQVMRESLALV